MSNPFVAEIRMFACNFAPKGWATCDGQLLPISQNTALFSLLGTTYGGNGQSTFALPNLAGSAPMHRGQGPGLSERFLGEQGGTESVTLLQSEMPLHGHSVNARSSLGTQQMPGGNTWAGNATARQFVAAASQNNLMAVESLSLTGGSLPHNNMSPYLTVLFCIAMQGIFPARN